MKFDKLDEYPNDIRAEIFLNEETSILIGEFSGNYRNGSKGNSDGLYMFSKLTYYYFPFEPICIILDFSKLQYTWGNTMLKVVNFMEEIGRDPEERKKKMFILASGKSLEAIKSLTEKLLEGEIFFPKDMDEAIHMAQKEVVEYLS